MRKNNKIALISSIIIICLILIGYIFNAVIITVKEMVNDEIPTWKKDTSPITFDWYINFSWFTQKWGEDITSQYVTDKTGVSINFITPPNDTGDNLWTLIANEEIPDFVTVESWDYVVQGLIDNGLVHALDELANKYDIYFTKVADPAKLEWNRQEDGHVYAYPNASMSVKELNDIKETDVSNQTFLVRKDIYEAIGKPDMRTPEGFIDALKKAKELYPEVNGEPLIPIGLHSFTNTGNYSLEGYLQNYLAIPREVDGKLYDRYTDAEYIRWLKTFRKANDLGLLAPDIFIDKKLQIEEKISQGRYFALMYQGLDMEYAQLELYSKDKNMMYTVVDGPANSALDEPMLEASNSISGWTVTLISKSCKNPERAISFLTYLMSEEGNKDLYLGKEGVTWETIDGKDQFKPEVLNLLNSNHGEFDRIYGAAHLYWMMMDYNVTKQWEPEPIEPLRALEGSGRGNTYNYSAFYNLSPKDNSTEGKINEQNLWLWGETLFKLITAESDDEFDRIYSAYISERDKLGYDKVVEYQQEKYEENKRKLGIK